MDEEVGKRSGRGVQIKCVSWLVLSAVVGLMALSALT